MTARLAAHILVSAVIRRVQDGGGFAAVLHRGDPVSGVILVQCLEKSRENGLFERAPDYAGGYRLTPCGPGVHADSVAVAEYLARRREADPDLWLIELDIADAERLAVEMLC